LSAFVENAVVRCCLLSTPITCNSAPEACATCPYRDTRDLVVSQCTECGWKSSGFRYAVDIAERAHSGRHGRLARQASVPVSVGVPRQASPRSTALAEAIRQPQPLSRFRIALVTLGSTALVGLLAALSRWLREQLNYTRPFGIPVHALFMLCVVASLVWMLMEWWAHWRRENIRRLSVVAECNHEIRNALELMTLAANSEDGIQQIDHAVQRIERTLSDILPAVSDSSVATYKSSPRSVVVEKLIG